MLAVFIFAKRVDEIKYHLLRALQQKYRARIRGARRKCHGLRIIALLYSRSRSYRRTRTRSVGWSKTLVVDTREFRRAGPSGWTFESSACSREAFITRACIYCTYRVFMMDSSLRKRRIIVLTEGRSTDTLGSSFVKKILPFHRPVGSRRADATGQSSSKGRILVMNYCFRPVRRCQRKLVCDGSW